MDKSFYLNLEGNLLTTSHNYRDTVSFTIDHGRGDWLGCWDKFVQKACFKNWFVYAILSKTTYLIWDKFVHLVYLCLPGSRMKSMTIKADLPVLRVG